MKTLNQILTAAKEAAAANQHDHALATLAQGSAQGDASAEYWWLKARYAQLGSGRQYELSEIGAFLRKAAELETNHAAIHTDVDTFFRAFCASPAWPNCTVPKRWNFGAMATPRQLRGWLS